MYPLLCYEAEGLPLNFCMIAWARACTRVIKFQKMIKHGRDLFVHRCSILHRSHDNKELPETPIGFTHTSIAR